jgi:phosphopantothenoylcysteine synthetase/decarboxylase
MVSITKARFKIGPFESDDNDDDDDDDDDNDDDDDDDGEVAENGSWISTEGDESSSAYST